MLNRDDLTKLAKTYFCPNGCNVFTTLDEDPECGACGSVMSDDPEPFYDVIEAMEERGIAEMERKLNL
jgi:hypothetical protein